MSHSCVPAVASRAERAQLAEAGVASSLDVLKRVVRPAQRSKVEWGMPNSWSRRTIIVARTPLNSKSVFMFNLFNLRKKISTTDLTDITD